VKSRLAIRALTVLMVLCGCLFASRAQDLPREPILRIDTGQHMATITAIDTDRAGRWLVTASADKTVRVWDVATGQMERVLRPPIGEDVEGELLAVAVSPDGRLVACEGSRGQSNNYVVHLFLRANGRLVGRAEGPLEGYTNYRFSVIEHLAFSPDGRMLAATLSGRGLRIFAVNETGNLSAGGSGRIALRPIAEDRSYTDLSYGVDFSPDGSRLVTATSSTPNGVLRLYDLGQVTTSSKTSRTITPSAMERPVGLPGTIQPISVKFSPDGSKVAVGFISTPVSVLSGRDLHALYAPDASGITSGKSLSRVAWSNDGRFLFAGGEYQRQFGAGGTWQSPVRRWEAGGQGAATDLLGGATDGITGLAPLPDGSLVISSADPAVGLLGPDGRQKWLVGPSNGDFRGGYLRLSQDGSKIGFGYKQFGADPATFSLADRSLILSWADASLSLPRTTAPGLDIQTPNLPTLNGQRLSMPLAIAPDGQSVLRGWRFLSRSGRDGKMVWRLQDPGRMVYAVNIVMNGNVAVASLGDGTIRWYRYSDGRELAAFFPHVDRKRWVLWTPSGYYDASPGGEELIGWYVNNGPDQAADFYPASRFHGTRYRPDVLSRVLSTLDEAEAVRLADAERGRAPETTTVAQALPPVITVTSPEDGSQVSSSTVALHYAVRTPSGEPVTRIRALVDGRPAPSDQGVTPAAKQGEERTITVTIPAHDCQVSLIAENRFSASEPSTVRLTWANANPSADRGVTVRPVPSAEAEFVAKPKLYLLAVGESAYLKPELKLAFAAKDAKDFAAAMQAQKGGLYRDVEVKLLPDAVKDQIEDGLDWLQHQVTNRDVGMIFLAGHGVDDSSGIYYFLPANADLDGLKRTGLVFSDIKTTMESIAGKAVMFVDTCHSGNVMGTRRGGPADINAVVNELASAENGMVVFAASTGRQYSLEDPQWQNGAFTKALVEGVKGKADYEHNGRITINMLDLYLSERVKELTKGQQTPTTTKPSTVADFPVAMKQ